jgi:pterin-4a-carbinolamine dehydratase
VDAETEARLFGTAERVAIDLETLGHDPDLRNPDQRAASLRESTLYAGMLWEASEVFIDLLTEDLVSVHKGRGSDDWLDAVQESNVLAVVPERFHHHITPGIATRFLVVAVDLTGRLSLGWRPCSCVAQELMLRALLGQVQALVDIYEVPVRSDWRDTLESHLFEDLDHEHLYDMSLDGFEDQDNSPSGMARMDFASWFVPFGPARRLPPYAEDAL